MPVVSVGPKTAMLNSHFRKDAENVPVFRAKFGSEFGFRCRIVGIVATSGAICARRDFLEVLIAGPESPNGMKFGPESE
jgi:hypothetical protein